MQAGRKLGGRILVQRVIRTGDTAVDPKAVQ